MSHVLITTSRMDYSLSELIGHANTGKKHFEPSLSNVKALNVMSSSRAEDTPTLKEIKAEERALEKQRKNDGVLRLPQKPSEDDPWGGMEEYIPSSEHKIYEIPPQELKLHNLTEIHRLHTDAEKEQMRQSFIERGQLVPVIMYRKKLVDGRHRLWTALDLNLDYLLVVKLDSNLTLDEVEQMVIDIQGGRQLTPSEKAIQAYMIMQKHNLSMRLAAKKCASSKTLISKVKFIVEILGLQKVKDLYDSKPVSVGASVATTVNRLYILAVEQDDAERKARCFNEPMPMPEVITASRKYIDALSKEHKDVIEYVSKWGWREARK